MERLTIMLPGALKARALHMARARGVSMAEFVRGALERCLDESPAFRERTLFDLKVFSGTCPPDVSARVDDYLYGER